MSDARGDYAAASHAASYWLATAQPAPSAPPLRVDAEADVAIVGAGFRGLSTAWHLQRAGISAIVLDANHIGWGASGRNGGMLPPRYKKGFATLARKYGHDVTRRLHRLILEAVDTVENIVDDGGFDCGFPDLAKLCAEVAVVWMLPRALDRRADGRALRMRSCALPMPYPLLCQVAAVDRELGAGDVACLV